MVLSVGRKVCGCFSGGGVIDNGVPFLIVEAGRAIPPIKFDLLFSASVVVSVEDGFGGAESELDTVVIALFRRDGDEGGVCNLPVLFPDLVGGRGNSNRDVYLGERGRLFFGIPAERTVLWDGA